MVTPPERTSKTPEDSHMTLAQAARNIERTVGAARRIRFCSRCGTLDAGRDSRPPAHGRERVCTECGMGILLSCSREALVTAGASFLIVTDDLRVSAVSQTAERMFAPEIEMLGSQLLRWMSSPLGADELAAGVTRTARGSREVINLPVMIANHRSRRWGSLEARIAMCGPPQAALVVVGSVSPMRLDG
jgi:hypothetical protein